MSEHRDQPQDRHRRLRGMAGCRRCAIGHLFAERMTWANENSSLAAGDCTDKADFFARVLAPFGCFAGSAEPFRPVRLRSIHADGDTVIVYFDGRGVAKDGIAYENTYAWFAGWRTASSSTAPPSSMPSASTTSCRVQP